MQDENKKEAIFEASIKLVNEIGFVAASVSKIAKEANVSPATIYIYHKNKEELLVSIYTEIKRRMSEVMLRGLSPDIKVKQALKIIWLNVFKYISENQSYFLFAEQFANSPFSEKVDKEKINEYFAPFIKLFQKGIEEKIIKNVSFDMLSVFGFYPVLLLSNKKNCTKFSDVDLDVAIEMAWDAISVK